jgi:hypothetical protein
MSNENKVTTSFDNKSQFYLRFSRVKMSSENSTEVVEKFIESDEQYIALKLTIFACLMVVLCIIAAFLVRRRLQHPYEHPVIVARRKSEMPT